MSHTVLEKNINFKKKMKNVIIIVNKENNHWVSVPTHKFVSRTNHDLLKTFILKMCFVLSCFSPFGYITSTKDETKNRSMSFGVVVLHIGL